MNTHESIFEIQSPGIFNTTYLAEVVSLDDPESQGRVQVRLFNCDGIADHDGPVWARLAVPAAGGNRGFFWYPDPGDEVLVTFVNGDPRLPVIVGGLWNGNDRAPEPADTDNNLKVLRSRNGVKITLDDTGGSETLTLETPGGQKAVLSDGPATVKIRDRNGNSITMSGSGITIRSAAKVTVEAAATAQVTAGMVTVDAALSQFNGIVKCDTMIANTVVASVYTPGAGNIW